MIDRTLAIRCGLTESARGHKARLECVRVRLLWSGALGGLDGVHRLVSDERCDCHDDETCLIGHWSLPFAWRPI